MKEKQQGKKRLPLGVTEAQLVGAVVYELVAVGGSTPDFPDPLCTWTRPVSKKRIN